MTLGPGAALIGWASILVALNLTGHPVIVAATFGGLVVLALRAGLRRLIALALLIGVLLLAVVPGFALIDGSFSWTYGHGAWRAPDGVAGWTTALASALRIPAQVLAAGLLAVVPARLLLAATSRISPSTAMLGGLTARLRPLLVRDIRVVRDELESRGLRVGPGAPIAARARGALALWEASISGILDRAIQTSATLETRGYGARRPTPEPLADAALSDRVQPNTARDRLIILAATGLLIAVTTARTTGTVAAPSAQALGRVEADQGVLVWAAAALGAAIGLLASSRRSSAPASMIASAGVSPMGAVPAAPTAGLALTVERAAMRYPDSSADTLSDVSLRVGPGELVVAVGASGSGKSTLLDVITGVAPRTTGGTRRGVIRLGRHVLGAVRGEADRLLAAVYQEPEGQVLVGHVAEEVAFGLRHAGVPIEEIDRRVRAVLERLDLIGLARRDCSTLSGGELQRVLLAAALVLEPALLILDEPTSQIDSMSERRFWDEVDAARRTRRVGVLVAEHRLEHVLHRADRVLVFDEGRIAASLDPAELQTAAPQLVASPYAGLAPASIPSHAPARLTMRIDRLEAAGKGAPTAAARTLLRGLGCSLAGGSIVTLEGTNGTGKSTLLRAVRGLHPVTGHVLVDGLPRAGVAQSARQFGYLGQSAGALLPGRTVAAAAMDTSQRLGVHSADATVLLGAAGLAERHEAHPSELSVGERQRLALLAATAHRPLIWLLDEPTRGMDAAARRWVATCMLAHAAAGGIVLLATHDSALAAAVATHRIRLDLTTGPTLVSVSRDASGSIVDLAARSRGAHASGEVER